MPNFQPLLFVTVLQLLIIGGPSPFSFLGRPNYVEGKDLDTDITQIKAIMETWPDELDPDFEVVAAEDIPGLPEDQEIYIVEKDPTNPEGQTYIVFKQKPTDSSKYTRHIALIRRYKQMSAVEWTPIENPTDNVADGDFVSFFAPSLFSRSTSCSKLITSAHQAMHNHFYESGAGTKCKLPTPEQNCCADEDDEEEEAPSGRALAELQAEEQEQDDEEEIFKDEVDLEPPEQGGPAGVEVEGNELKKKRRRRRRAAAATLRKSDKRAIKLTKVIAQDILEELKDSLKHMEGPPGYTALGEFFRDVLDVMNGSRIAYEARTRVEALVEEAEANGEEAPILETENFMTIGGFRPRKKDGVPSFEDPQSAYTGVLTCNYTDFKSEKQAMDKLPKNIANFYVHKMRAQCIHNAYEKTLALFTKDILHSYTGLRTELNSEHGSFENGLLTKQQWLDFISAIFLTTLSNSYMDMQEKITRSVDDNRDASGGEISWTVRTLTLMIIRLVKLVDELLDNHVVKTLQLTAWAAKDNFLKSLYSYVKLESLCKARPGLNCTQALIVLKNDQVQLLSLMQFVVFGSSTALQRKHHTLQVEYNMFYLKTKDHMKGILEKVYAIRESMERVAEQDAEADKANEGAD